MGQQRVDGRRHAGIVVAQAEVGQGAERVERVGCVVVPLERTLAPLAGCRDQPLNLRMDEHRLACRLYLGIAGGKIDEVHQGSIPGPGLRGGQQPVQCLLGENT